MHPFGFDSMNIGFVPLKLKGIVMFLSTLFTPHPIMYIEFVSFQKSWSSKASFAFIAMVVSPIFMFGQNMFFKVSRIFEDFFTIGTLFGSWLFLCFVISIFVNDDQVVSQAPLSDSHKWALIANKKFFSNIFWGQTPMNLSVVRYVETNSSKRLNTRFALNFFKP
jgi:hypothetical protein